MREFLCKVFLRGAYINKKKYDNIHHVTSFIAEIQNQFNNRVSR